MAIGLACLTVFLEDGERNDWFGSQEITWLCVASVVFLLSFLVIELNVKKPFVNLRLLKEKNFGVSSGVNFVVGMSLYGAIYLLPTYLASIQLYSAVSIGRTIMWSGFPQLIILPFIPYILRKFDARKTVFVGMLLFGMSCYMNSRMTSVTGYDQLKWSQIVRALGQPLVIMPLSGIATAMIAKQDAGSASGLFNMMRNLGGSVGIAMLSTLLSVREKFHSAKIVEGITMYHPETVKRLQAYTHHFLFSGLDAHTAHARAIGVLDALVRRQSYVMSFNDCFLLLAVALWISGGLVLFCDKVNIGGGAGGGH